MEIIEKVRLLASNILQDKGIELIEIVYRREGQGMVLRLIVDKKDGVTIDECGAINEQLGETLGKENIFMDNYILEVASPGLDRRLKSRKDFEWVQGKLVRVGTYGPVEDKREHLGTVVSCDDDSVTIELKDGKRARKIPLGMISAARLEVEF